VPVSHFLYILTQMLILFRTFKDSAEWTIENLNLLIKIAQSSHLITRATSKDLPTHLQPDTHELRHESWQLICKCTQLPLKQACKKYLRNRHLVKRLLQEKKQRPSREPKRSFSSIKDGEVFER